MNLINLLPQKIQEELSHKSLLKVISGLSNFDLKSVKKISEAGCKTIILHARRAILKGLTPKENLKIPKLNYPMVHEIKKSNKDLEIILNGGITNSDQIIEHLNKCDGVMIGRAIYQNPYFLADIEKRIFKNSNLIVFQKIYK